MKAPLLFLARFLGISLVLFVVWGPVSALYLSCVTPVVNGIGRVAGYPVHLEPVGNELLNVFQLDSGELRLWANNPDVVFLNLIVLLGLFGAYTYGRLRLWLGRLAAGLALLWVSHVVHLGLLSYVAAFRYLRRMANIHDSPTPELLDLAEAADRFFPYHLSVRVNLALDFWRNWGMLAFAFLIWIVLNRRELRLLAPARQAPPTSAEENT